MCLWRFAPDLVILAFSPNDIVIKDGKSLDYDSNPKMREYIESRWKNFVKQRISRGYPAPINGNLVRVSKMPFINSEGKIELYLARSNYKEHIATNFQNEEAAKNFVREHPEYEFSLNLSFEQNANGLTNLGILATADDYLVYSKRSSGTATFGNTLSGFGIVIHTPEEIEENGRSAYFFKKIEDSVWKETGMSNSPNSDVLRGKLKANLGGYAYLTDGFNIPLFVVNTELEKGEMEEFLDENSIKIKGSSQNKYSGFGFVKIKEEDYREFLKSPNLVKTIRPIWTYLAIERFGLDFLLEMPKN